MRSGAFFHLGHAATAVVVTTTTVALLHGQPEGTEHPAPAVTDVRKALGRSIDSAEVRAVTRAFKGVDPTVHLHRWQSGSTWTNFRDIIANYHWKSQGCELIFTREEAAGADWKFDTAWLYAGGIRGHARYRGELPPGLKFGASPADVVRVLGRPGDEFGLDHEEPGLGRGKAIIAKYRKTGIAVVYWEGRAKAPELAAVGIFVPGGFPCWW